MPRYDIYKTLANTTANIKLLRAFNPFNIHKKGTRAKAIFALAVVCVLWGTTWIASKEGVSHMPALQLAGIRQIIAGVLYVGFFIYRKAIWPKGKEWIPIIVLSFLNFILSNGLSTWGVQYISAGLGSIMGAIFPLWLVVIGLFTAKSKLPRNALIGLLLGFGGVCVIFYPHLKDFLIPDFRLGIILSLIATWTWAFASLYTKQQANKFNPYFGLGLQMVIAGITLVITTEATGLSIPIASIPWKAWAAIAYLVLFGSIITFIAYLYALQNLPTEQASIYAYINPIVAVMCGSLFFGEHISGYIVVGGLVALLGVFMVNRAFKIIPPPEQPETEGI
ncbi:MAG TPA: EamA family transporter [Chitinophagaceae bacterium]|nr:EamA family transporter [Chitinophagaceae bacterium]HQZ76195.1 EamA family transporter [Chitinophagaceae bacterium]